MGFLNERRIRDYPRLLFITLWGVLLINVIFHKGWVGRFGGIIGVDFLCFYSSGMIYKTSLDDLYNIEAQARLQQELLNPTPLHGTVNIFTYPPYGALAFSIFSWLPLKQSFIIYSVFLLLVSATSIFLIHKYLVPEHLKPHLPLFQTGIILFSSLPFTLGIFFGQNSSLTLFLLTLIVLATLKKKWGIAGITAGLLLYKPHYVLGFLIIWLAWRRFSALIGFGGVAAAWVGSVIARYGLHPFEMYASVVNQFMDFPYAEGLKLDVTPYALILGLTPPDYSHVIRWLNFVLIGVLSFGLFLISLKSKPKSEANQIPPLIYALLFPFLISPHTLIYDLIPLILPLMLWSWINASRTILSLAIFTFLGPLILPGFTKILPVHLLAFIPITLSFHFFRELINTYLPKRQDRAVSS